MEGPRFSAQGKCRVIVLRVIYLGLDGLSFTLQTADHAVELSDLSLGVPQLVPILCGLAGHLVILEKGHKHMLDIFSFCSINCTLSGIIMFKYFTLENMNGTHKAV